MAKVHSSRARIYEKKSTTFDEPTEHVESEGERLIKELVLKQIDTQVSLPDALKNNKEFEKATEYVPLTNFTSGKVSLQEFEKCANRASYIEELKSSGLTDEEIELILDHEKGEEFFAEKYKKWESSILNSWLQQVLSKIRNIEREHNEVKAGSSSISRHEQELALAVKPESEHTKLLKFALSCQQSSDNNDPRPIDHPINHLKDIEHELFGHLNKKEPPPWKPKRSLNALSTPKFKSKDSIKHSSLNFKSTEKPSTLWDLKETFSVPTTISESTKPSRVYSCKPETLYSIKDKKIVPLNKIPPLPASSGNPSCSSSNNVSGQPFVVTKLNESEIKTLGREDILKNRLSIEEIKKLPRFQNYEKGSPTQVLFVKNLPNRIKEAELVSVFGMFDDTGKKRVIYRLMTGKMKGQAFITFPSIEKATEALELVNGFLLRKKPMIIQYGHTNSSFFKIQE
ncbi:hypothetical protein C0J52_10186 [Blattella germanica]|nr:hypothetical protein C0J52_10186 [Blattella germanica]